MRLESGLLMLALTFVEDGCSSRQPGRGNRATEVGGSVFQLQRLSPQTLRAPSPLSHSHSSIDMLASYHKEPRDFHVKEEPTNLSSQHLRTVERVLTLNGRYVLWTYFRLGLESTEKGPSPYPYPPVRVSVDSRDQVW